MSKNPEIINSRPSNELFDEDELNYEIERLSLENNPKLSPFEDSKISSRKRALSEMSDNSELVNIFDSMPNGLEGINEEISPTESNQEIFSKSFHKKQRSFSAEKFSNLNIEFQPLNTKKFESIAENFEPRKRSFSADELSKRAQQNNNRNGQNSR